MHTRLFLIAAGGALACACGSGAGTVDATVAADARPIIDAPPPRPDSAASLSWIDFAVTGCTLSPATEPAVDAGLGSDSGAQAMRSCAGAAPLELRFSAVASATIDSYRWTFGDGQESSQASPVYTYADPGRYTVGLTVGGPSGTAEVVRIDIIDVSPAPAGHGCTAIDQCAVGLQCLCGAGEDGCAPALESGRCTAECDAVTPCADGACVDLAAGQPAAPAPWQRALCLPGCAADADCPRGLSCQELPAADGAWVRACFAPGVLRAVGESCTDASGQPMHSACASGYCAPMGARGMCSAPCAAGACPESSACANFAGGQPDSCIPRCASPTSCGGDPWLACADPGGPGAYGFTVDEPAAEFGYCAPKACAGAGDCGPDGACTAGYCGP